MAIAKCTCWTVSSSAEQKVTAYTWRFTKRAYIVKWWRQNSFRTRGYDKTQLMTFEWNTSIKITTRDWIHLHAYMQSLPTARYSNRLHKNTVNSGYKNSMILVAASDVEYDFWHFAIPYSTSLLITRVELLFPPNTGVLHYCITQLFLNLRASVFWQWASYFTD